MVRYARIVKLSGKLHQTLAELRPLIFSVFSFTQKIILFFFWPHSVQKSLRYPATIPHPDFYLLLLFLIYIYIYCFSCRENFIAPWSQVSDNFTIGVNRKILINVYIFLSQKHILRVQTGPDYSLFTHYRYIFFNFLFKRRMVCV